MAVPFHGRGWTDRIIFAVTSQCRGLVVLESESQEISYLCNPSTGQITALPPRLVSSDKPALGFNRASTGLGYDPSIRRHKVVRLYHRRGGLPPVCEVYVPDTTGYWRPPANGAGSPCSASNFSTERSVFAQGHVYWAAWPYEQLKGRRLIMSFSIVNEVFGVVPSPPGMDTYDMVGCKMTELGGASLRLPWQSRCPRPLLRRKFFDVWVLRDHGMGAWDLHCRIDPATALPALTQLVNIWKVTVLDTIDDGSRLLLRRRPFCCNAKENLEAHRLVAYRPATGETEDLLAGNDGGTFTDGSTWKAWSLPGGHTRTSFSRRLHPRP